MIFIGLGLFDTNEDAGEFLDNRIDVAAPPFTEIASLERASRAIEEDPDNKELMGQKWLRMLIAPGDH